MDIFEQLDPQAILVLLMVIFAAIKAFFEQRKKVGSEVTLEEETNLDLYQALTVASQLNWFHHTTMQERLLSMTFRNLSDRLSGHFF